MLRRWILAAPLLGACFAAPIAHADSEDADAFASFRIPAHRVLVWDGSMQGFGNGDRNGTATFNQRSTRWTGALGSNLDWFAENDRRALALRVTGAASSSNEQDFRQSIDPIAAPFISSSSDDVSVDSFNELLSLGASGRWYPFSRPIGWIASGVGFGRFNQQDGDEQASSTVTGTPTNRSELQREGLRSTYEYRVDGSVGMGYGRVRDATGIYEARILEARLRARGALTRPLSSGARGRLAEWMYLRADVARVRDAPAHEAWAGLVAILNQDGGLNASSLSATDLLESTDPYFGAQSVVRSDLLPVVPFARLSGWMLSAMLTGSHTHIIDRQDFASTQSLFQDDVLQATISDSQHFRFSDESQSLFLGPQVELHRPLSLGLQADASASLGVPLRSAEDGMQLQEQVGLNWLVTDRWLAGVSLSHQRRISKDHDSGELTQDSWSYVLDGSASYYLREHLNLTLRLTRSEASGMMFSFPSAGNFQRQDLLSLALGYRLAGWRAAPGFVPDPSSTGRN